MIQFDGEKGVKPINVYAQSEHSLTTQIGVPTDFDSHVSYMKESFPPDILKELFIPSYRYITLNTVHTKEKKLL